MSETSAISATPSSSPDVANGMPGDSIVEPQTCQQVLRYRRPGEAERRQLLQRRDVDAFMDLYDQIAPWAYSYALGVTHSDNHAGTAICEAFLDARRNPGIFADSHLPVPLRMLLHIHRHLRHPSP